MRNEYQIFTHDQSSLKELFFNPFDGKLSEMCLVHNSSTPTVYQALANDDGWKSLSNDDDNDNGNCCL